MKLNRRAFLIGSAAIVTSLVVASKLPFELLKTPRLLASRKAYEFEMLTKSNVHLIGYGKVMFVQVESGKFATSHIPTNGTPVTRANEEMTVTLDDNMEWDAHKGLGTTKCIRDSPAYLVDEDNKLHTYGNNIPRITSQGLLTEESRTNLLSHSDPAEWTSLMMTTIFLEKGPHVLSFYGEGHISISTDSSSVVLFNRRPAKNWTQVNKQRNVL